MAARHATYFLGPKRLVLVLESNASAYAIWLLNYSTRARVAPCLVCLGRNESTNYDNAATLNLVGNDVCDRARVLAHSLIDYHLNHSCTTISRRALWHRALEFGPYSIGSGPCLFNYSINKF